MDRATIRTPEQITIHHLRWQRLLGWILLAAPWCLAPAAAAPILTGLNRTGVVAMPSGLLRSASNDSDPFWRVVAVPETPAFSSEASRFSGRGPSFPVPKAWFRGADGFDGAGWIGLRPETTKSLYPANVGAKPDYTVIYATTFMASEAGQACFDLTATADNELSFFVNGAVSDSVTMNPSIIGGMQIGVARRGLSRLHQFQGYADVLEGENTLYAVVRDRYTLAPATNIGSYGHTGLLVAAVPEPGTLVLGLVGGAFLVIGRECRRRTRASRSVRARGTSAEAWGRGRGRRR